MKRSRRMLLMCSEESDSAETTSENKEVRKSWRKILIRRGNVSPDHIFTSPSSGQTLCTLQNASFTPSVTPSTAEPRSKRIQVLEDIVIKPGCSKDSCVNQMSKEDCFSTPTSKQYKFPKHLLSFKSPTSEKDTFSVASMSKCSSLNDVSVSDLVSLNSSFNEEQFFNLLATPSLKRDVSPVTPTMVHTETCLRSIINPSVSEPSISNVDCDTDIHLFENDSDESSSDKTYSPSSDYSSDSMSETSREDENNFEAPPPQALSVQTDDDDGWQDISDDHPEFDEYVGTSKISVPSDVKNPDEFYRLFLTDELIDKIVLETNNFAVKCLTKNQGTNLVQYNNNSHVKDWKPTDRDEMLKFFAIMLVMGLTKVPNLKYYWSYKKIYRNEYIISLMSRDRFFLLLKYWHFSDDSSGTQNDKLSKIRTVYDMILTQFNKVLTPGKVLVIDESMIPWRGRLRFRQYIKNKSHKYGVKLYKLCTPEGYTYNIIVYTGKEDSGRDVNHGQNIVLKLIQGLEQEGRIVIVDNFYTSIALAEALIAKKTFICGTLRSNRRGLPKKIVTHKLKKGQILGKMKSNGVRVIKWVDKRPVLMLSTCKDHDIIGIKDTGKKRRGCNENIKKPECILSYNKYKKGIDYSDQMSSYYSTLKKGLKWYRKVMMELLFGTALINAWIVYNIKNSQKMTKLDFVERIIEKFGNAQVTDRNVRATNNNASEDEDQANKHFLTKGSKKRNCFGCYNKLRRTLSCKEAAKKVKKVMTHCAQCTKTYCHDCYNEAHTVFEVKIN